MIITYYLITLNNADYLGQSGSFVFKANVWNIEQTYTPICRNIETTDRRSE